MTPEKKKGETAHVRPSAIEEAIGGRKKEIICLGGPGGGKKDRPRVRVLCFLHFLPTSRREALAKGKKGAFGRRGEVGRKRGKMAYALIPLHHHLGEKTVADFFAHGGSFALPLTRFFDDHREIRGGSPKDRRLEAGTGEGGGGPSLFSLLDPGGER